VLFQPHRYTRTQHLWDDFCKAFHLADVLLLVDLYPAGEEPVEGVNSETLAAAIGKRGHRQAIYAGDMKTAIDRLCQEVREGDVVLTLGAGSVWTAGDELLKRRSGGGGA
jgi:UDP-N-acetylmuramate--alanine ligase